MNIPSDFNLSGRSALITGSTRGIGRSLALALARAGADVAIHGTSNPEQASKVVNEASALGVQAVAIMKDLSDDDAPEVLMNEVSAAFGRLDILVANVSVQLPKPWLQASREDFEFQVRVNLRCTYELIQLAAPKMQERRWGRILTIGSVQEAMPHPDMVVYAAMKSAQTSMVRNLAKQLAPYGIVVNNLAPGVIGTDRNRCHLEDEANKKRALSRIPVGRIGSPDDCAGAALLLCSDAARYLTGQSFYVDGGLSL